MSLSGTRPLGSAAHLLQSLPIWRTFLTVPLLALLAATFACSAAPTSERDSSLASASSIVSGGDPIGPIGPIIRPCKSGCGAWSYCDTSDGQCIGCGQAGEYECPPLSTTKGCEPPSVSDGPSTAGLRLCIALSAGACPAWMQLSSDGAECVSCGGVSQAPCTEPSAGSSGCRPSELLEGATCVQCGGDGEPACAGGVCDTGTLDMGGTCTVPCGASGQPACPGGVCNPGTSNSVGTCCATGTTSFEGQCVPCGAYEQPGCGGNGCGGSYCAGGTCNPGLVLGSIGTLNGVCACATGSTPANGTCVAACGGAGGPCPDGLCNPGAINDGNGHCVQCSSVFATSSMTTTSQQPNFGYWDVEFEYSIGLPSAPSFRGLVTLVDSASGSTQTQTVYGPTGTATFWVPMLTAETATLFASVTNADDPTCAMPINPAENGASWNDQAGVSGVSCPSTPAAPTPTLSTNGGGSRGGPVTIVPLLWGFSDLAFAQSLENVYGLIGSSNYYAWLRREYGAPQITTIAPISVLNVDVNGGSVSSQLADWIRANVPSEIAPVQGPIVYVVHLSPGTTVKIASGPLCAGGVVAYNTKGTSFNLLEGTFDYYYAVIPDPSTPCNGQPQLGFDAMTVVLSHELAENLTDPDGQTGWEARSCTSSAGPVQIGDICVGELPVSARSTHEAAISNPLDPANAVVVQKLWSNLLGACVTEDAPGVPFN
jgi:hypothetical protein